MMGETYGAPTGQGCALLAPFEDWRKDPDVQTLFLVWRAIRGR